MFTIPLSRADVQTAKRLAEQSARHFAGKPGHYGNEPMKHLTGHLGEVALARWLTARGVEHHARFTDPKQYEWCDIETWCPALTIEVKTWSAYHWPALGRCVAAKQAASVRRKARLLAWMVAPNLHGAWSEIKDGLVVTLAGWNTVAEVLAQPKRPTGEKQIINHQVRLDQVRQAVELAALLAGVPA